MIHIADGVEYPNLTILVDVHGDLVLTLRLSEQVSPKTAFLWRRPLEEIDTVKTVIDWLRALPLADVDASLPATLDQIEQEMEALDRLLDEEREAFKHIAPVPRMNARLTGMWDVTEYTHPATTN